MFRRLWARISGSQTEQYVPGESEAGGAVVPLRRGDKQARELAENLVVTKKDHVERLYEAVNQLVNKLDGIHTHLGSQVSQNEQLLDHIRRLPDMLNGVPESMQKQQEAIQSLTAELRKKAAADFELSSKIAVLPEETVKQTQVLEEIGKQIFASAQSEEAMSQNFSHLAQSVSRLDENTVSQTEWVQRMSRAFTETDRFLKDTLSRQQKRMIWIYLATAGMSLIAVAGLVIAILVLRGGV